jgi:hypothetical protein
MKHEEVLETVDAQFLDGWRRAKGAHLTLNINPLNGLENTIEKLFEELGWEQIDHDLLIAHVPNVEKFEELAARKGAGEQLTPEETSLYFRLQNRALGQYGKAVFDEIKQRHGL